MEISDIFIDFLFPENHCAPSIPGKCAFQSVSIDFLKSDQSKSLTLMTKMAAI